MSLPKTVAVIVTACLAIGTCELAAQAVQTPVAAAGTLSMLDALRSTLGYHPQIEIGAKQVVVNQAVLQQVSGAFDTTLRAGAGQNYQNTPLNQLQRLGLLYAGTPAESIGTDVTGFNAGAGRLFRNGISVNPVWTVQRLRDTQGSIGGVNTSQLTMQVTVPLLQNRGRDVVTAQETSARLSVDASIFDLNEITAEALANTAFSYWGYVAALSSLDVARASEERGGTLVSNVQALIDADKVPRSEIQQVRANLAQRSADRVSTEQQVVAAQQQLALAMGLTAVQVGALGRPSQDLPAKASATPQAGDALIRRYITEALDRRADLMAARKRIGATQSQVLAARNRILPQLDVTFGAGYDGLRDGVNPGNILLSPFQGVHGANATAGISYNFSRQNNVAKGQLQQAEAQQRQSELRLDEATRTVASSVIVAVNEVRSAAEGLTRGSEAVALFRDALDAEREKFRLGISSLIDMLTVEDRLTAALNSEVRSRLIYADALVRLRLATGTVVAPDQPVRDVDDAVFSRLPFDNSPTQ